MHKHQLFKITALGLVILILHGLFTIAGLYESFWWWDIPMHFLGGIAIAIASYYLLQHFEHRNLLEIRSKVIYFLIIISIVGLSAVAWEIFEFFIDQFLNLVYMQMSLKDTLKDICMGILGGNIIAALVIFKKNK